MHGLKSAILAILREIGRLAGLAMPSISAHRKWLYQLLPIKYELKLPSETTPGLLPFRFRSRSKQCVLSCLVSHNADHSAMGHKSQFKVVTFCLDFCNIFVTDYLFGFAQC